MSKARRKIAEKIGRRAEYLAALLLQCKGYIIVERRWKSRLGEIDLIVRRGKTLVFTEIKYRKTGANAHALSPFQADRLVRAASLYISMHPLDMDMQTRFDLLLLGPWKLPRHIKGAFMANTNHMGSIS